MFLGLESGFRDSLGRSRDVSGLAVFTASWGARSHGRLPARRQPGPPGWDTGASFRAEPYCFPLRPVPVLAPTHSSCFLICIFFCMDMPSSDKQGFLFFWASLVRLFSFRSCVRPLGSGVSLLCPLSPKMKGVTEACREM